MSEEKHRWIVRDSVNGWCVEHDGPSRMSFQPDQYGRVGATWWHGRPVIDSDALREATRSAHARLLGKRFGTRFSEERRLVCCEYAAELNSQMGEGA